jgi:hypothetical protein
MEKNLERLESSQGKTLKRKGKGVGATGIEPMTSTVSR